MNVPSPCARPAPDTISDPGGAAAMDNEGGAAVAPPCPLAEAERLHERAAVRRAALLALADAHSDEITAAYDAIDQARRWRLPESVEEAGWEYRGGLEEESTGIWARAHMAHWVLQAARVTVAKVRSALGLPVDDVDLLDDAERDAYIASLSDQEREELAGPWPVEWLYAPKPGAPIRVVNLFAGPGGWCEGIVHVLGEPVDMVGVDISEAACATAQAAGFRRICASVTDLDPANPALRYVVAVILSPPCQTLSPGGKLAGLAEEAMGLVEEVISQAGAAAGFVMVDDAGDGMEGYAPPTGATWDEVRAPLAGLKDARTGLMAEAVIWPLALQARHNSIRWVAMEQSSNLLKAKAAEYVVEAIASEFYGAGWEYAKFSLVEAADYGAASKKNRTFMVCMRYARPFTSYRPSKPVPATTWAACMGWEKGHKVTTRGVRGINPLTGRPKGGGTFTADEPGTTVTGTAYGWKREADGLTHTHADLGRAVGFRADFPWTHVGRGEGIRNKTQLIADTVSPMAAAAWIGHILGRAWEARTRAYVRSLYALRRSGSRTLLRAAGEHDGTRPATLGRVVPAKKRAIKARTERAAVRTAQTAAARTAPGTTAPSRKRRPVRR
ncbi:DNA cytosine methyltransferase [Streptomyces lavendulocolor]